MTHDSRTTPSKLDCALPTLHPKHSSARGAITRIRYTCHRALDSSTVYVCQLFYLTRLIGSFRRSSKEGVVVLLALECDAFYLDKFTRLFRFDPG